MAECFGIIGGGQLGAFLCEAATRLGVESAVVAPEGQPALPLATYPLPAAYDDANAIERLGSLCSVVTYEFEDVPDATLKQLVELASGGQTAVFPRPETLMLLKDKLSQKTWLAEHDFPTSPFMASDENSTFAEAAEQIGLPFVQKARTGGIDGRGVQILRAGEEANFWQAPTLVEAFVEDATEFAVVVARSVSGETRVYPLVEQLFDPAANIMKRAFCPANVTPEIEQAARQLGEAIVTALDGVGVFAVELFLDPSGQLLVNEIAPRVHNSGHLSLEAHATSQFEQHLRAISDRPLGSVQQHQAAVTMNVLFEPGLQRFCELPHCSWQSAPGTQVHWYGKREGRPGRKMGHVTALAETLPEAVQQAETAIQSLATGEASVA